MKKVIDFFKKEVVLVAAFVLAVIFATIGSITTILGPDRLSEITDTIATGLSGTIDTDKINSIAMFSQGL